jgi:glutamyl-tRNA reductase
MRVLSLGLSHRTAPVELRERLSYTPQALSATLARFGNGHDTRPPGFEELTIVSTCNRLELYAASRETDFEPLIDFVAETTSVPRNEFMDCMYSFADEDAALHLCRVAAGLDSMVLGEPQILGQITEAYSVALAHGAAGSVLSQLMRGAIHAGKRARTETAISRNPATISSVAVKLAEGVVTDLRSAHVLVIGSGEMAELALIALRSRGVSRVTVVSRTLENGYALAERFGGETLTFDRLGDALATADIAIGSTAAPHIVVDVPMVEAAMRHRPDRPLFFIDIAVPRDIEPGVARIPNVHLYDVDDLQDHLKSHIAERQGQVPHVEAIVREEADLFLDWLRRLDVTPVIAELRAHAEIIRRAEVEKALRQFAHLDEADRRKIEALTQAILNKILHEPTVRLKAEASRGRAKEFAAAVSHLFGLVQ